VTTLAYSPDQLLEMTLRMSAKPRAWLKRSRVDFGLDLALDTFKLAAIHGAIKRLRITMMGFARLPALDLGGIPVAHCLRRLRDQHGHSTVGLDLDEMRSLAGADCRTTRSSARSSSSQSLPSSCSLGNPNTRARSASFGWA